MYHSAEEDAVAEALSLIGSSIVPRALIEAARHDRVALPGIRYETSVMAPSLQTRRVGGGAWHFDRDQINAFRATVRDIAMKYGRPETRAELGLEPAPTPRPAKPTKTQEGSTAGQASA